MINVEEEDLFLNQSIKLTDSLETHNYRKTLLSEEVLLLADILNFRHNKKSISNSCLMCGIAETLSKAQNRAKNKALKQGSGGDRDSNGREGGVIIKKQNKNVCNKCDSVAWVIVSLQLIVKFCKGK